MLCSRENGYSLLAHNQNFEGSTPSPATKSKGSMKFKDDPHAKLYIRSKILELIADCKEVDFESDKWKCLYCGSYFTQHLKGCPIALLVKAYSILKKEEDV